MSPIAPASRARARARARTIAGLPDAIDAVAGVTVDTHRFLRRQWFAAALNGDGGTARTVLVERGAAATIALPLVGLGPAVLGLGQVPGCYWPFRSAPVADGADRDDFAALLAGAGRAVRGFRLGPVYDDDPLLAGLLAAVQSAGWRALPRFIADSYLLDMAALRAEGDWPRNSTLRKNRFNEKHLAAQGVPEWSFVQGGGWTDTVFDELAAIEAASWIGQRTDGRDAKFTDAGHGRFWRGAARDPVLAGMMSAALLRMDGAPAAFSFDLNAGTLKYAIANSFDARFARHSPGRLLYYRNLVRSIDDGIDRVDWGAGDSGYKRVIGATPGPAIRDWLFLRPGLPALAGRLLAGRWAGSGQRPAGKAEAPAE
ncbi:GNAT family N-acetyltransferase [Sphingomonas sp. 2R-10]|uniref:GNAT family N-acetyltransferase n=1 Tax=Sphingomonas sp. 2R-10 TaxID=3045148 RepID=UPI000F76D6EB|nr:GNAT family N-acetyltransferase [Sphingomonas sp. 2R-10]MDJ0278478.1 GNAT family N-acetyltransferase [Sphingomonas sp. 2R-10]